jgi:hypothetical protein
MDQGDLSAYNLPLGNPLTGAQFANGVIPQSQFSPIAGAVLAALPWWDSRRWAPVLLSARS